MVIFISLYFSHFQVSERMTDITGYSIPSLRQVRCVIMENYKDNYNNYVLFNDRKHIYRISSVRTRAFY